MNISNSTKNLLVKNLGMTILITGLVSCGGGGGGYGGGGGGGGTATYKPTVSFSSPASAMTIKLGQTVTLTWSSTYADSCTASMSSVYAGNFTGMQPTDGTMIVTPSITGNMTYMLSCTSSGGTTSATSAVVTVAP